MTKLGIIGAMQEEVETLLALMDSKKELSKAGSVFYEGVLEGLNNYINTRFAGK